MSTLYQTRMVNPLNDIDPMGILMVESTPLGSGLYVPELSIPPRKDALKGVPAKEVCSCGKCNKQADEMVRHCSRRVTGKVRNKPSGGCQG
jgi:hypothetical protein